jgi:hypothetical protein
MKMKECKPVSVPNAAFNFCKYTVAIILWVAFFLKLKVMVGIAFLILALSAILKIKKAPLVFLYTHTINKLFKSENVVLDENGMRFAHTMGSVLTFICLILLYFVNDTAGWVMTFIVCLAKTAGALGFCTALKLYGCLNSSTCCSEVKKYVG